MKKYLYVSWQIVLTVAVIAAITILKTVYNTSIASQTPFLLYEICVIFAAYLGGVIPGILAVIATAILADIYFLYDTNLISTQIQVLFYVLQGFIIVWMIGRQKSFQEKLIEVNRTLEVRVKKRTKELQEKTKELRRSNEALEDFAYVASHDLQEPLRKIQSFGHLLEDEADNLNVDTRMYLERIIDAATRMRKLINDLLLYSRVSSQKQFFHPVDLNAVIHQVQNALEIAIEETATEIDTEVLPEVVGDESQLNQLFLNLIGNAIKYSKDNVPPRIKISATVKKNYNIIAVSDNGMGFDEKHKDKIFNLFERIHLNHRQGTGIGLSICKKIVEQHGGKIEVESKKNQGTTFYVYLPIRQSSREVKLNDAE